MASERGLIGSILIIILTGGLIGLIVLVVRDTPNSLPGDFVYPVKDVVENLKLAQYELEYVERTNIYLNMTQARLTEIERLIEKRNKDKEIIATIQRLLDVQAKAITNLGRAKTQGGNIYPLFDKLESILQEEQNVLPELIFDLSQPATEAINKVIDQSEIDLERLNSMR